ncbi:MAG: helix-turn-helix domain-containing protein [Lachnospiraceae bacterium]|nr:helix-turn-helix domain-containing protein [Lachnospiraceae bacterium]
MHERLRLIRENQKMIRAVFGERLGVSGDVINNLERGRVEIKEHIIKLVCLEFNVNEDWFRNGNGSMFDDSPSDSIDSIIKQKGADELEISIIRAYFELDPELRSQILKHFKGKFSAIKSQTEMAEDEYIKSRSSFAQNMDSSASNITSEKNNA